MPNSPAERIAPERLAEIIELNGKKTWGHPNSAVSHCAALLGHIAKLEAENKQVQREKSMAHCEWKLAQKKLDEIARNLVAITAIETDYATNIDYLAGIHNQLDECASALVKAQADLAEARKDSELLDEMDKKKPSIWLDYDDNGQGRVFAFLTSPDQWGWKPTIREAIRGALGASKERK